MTMNSRALVLMTALVAVHAFHVPSPVYTAAARTAIPTMGPFDVRARGSNHRTHQADSGVHFSQFLAFGQAAASHILLKDGGKANYIKQQIEDGKMSFTAAAKEFSTCPSASKGGDLGAFARGAMVGPFDEYCYDPDTKVNELGIVRTQFGTHIVKLTKKP